MAKTANEELLDASIRHQIHLLRFSEGEAQTAAKLLADSDAELVAMLAKELTEDGAANLAKSLTEIRRLRANLAKQMNQTLQESLDELAVAEADWELSALEGSIPIKIGFNAVAPSLLKAVASTPISGVPLEGWLEKMAVNDVSRIEQQVRLGVLEGETISQITRRLQGTKAAEYADGVFKTTRREAEMIARTSVNHVSTASRQSVWNANSDILEGLRWVSTLDGRTSSVCQSRDGEVYPLDSGPRTPAHPNCRSTMAPVVKGDKIVGTRATVTDTRTRRQREIDFRAEAKAAAGDKWSGMSELQRREAIKLRRQDWIANNIGSAPTSVNYQKWLEGQSIEFQNDLLGPGKADLFRNGMTLDKFVDAKGHPYSLQQLKASIAGDKLNVVQPGVGLKAKALLQQGFTPQEALSQILKEYPDAKTTMASMASYKSELNKAGALTLPAEAQVPKTALKQAQSVQSVLSDFETNLPENVKYAIGGEWASVVESLEGAPGAYGYYQAGKGVQLSGTKLAAIPQVQAKQIMAHELGHLLHKQHDVKMLMSDAQIKIAAKELSPDAKKLYSYYLSSPDELIAELYAQALSPSVVTSQGLSAMEFNQAFGGYINAAKVNIANKFPPPPKAKKAPIGAPSQPFEAAGKHTTVGSLAKALLQQGLPDEDVLKAVLAEFPNAKTKMASIKSYKSVMKSEGKLANKAAGPTVQAKVIPDVKPAPVAAETVTTTAVNTPEFMTAPPYPYKITGADLKTFGLQAMKAGVLENKKIVELLSKQFPQNASSLNLGKVATWKSLWKKDFPAEYAAAEKLEKLGFKKAAETGPILKPKLHGQSLGPMSAKALDNVKSVLISGGSKEDAYAAMKAIFGDIKEPGASDLLDLAKYDLATLKAQGKPYIQAITPKPTVKTWEQKQAETLAEVAKIDFTPKSLAARPREGFPPPPRFTDVQQSAAIQKYGQMSPGALEKVNKRQKAQGLPDLTLAEVSAIKTYTGSSFSQLNRALRAGKYAEDLPLQAFVEATQHGMMKMPKFHGLSSRGMNLNSGELEKMLSTYRTGAVVEDDAFVSSSAGSQAAFSGNVYMKIQGKSGVDISFFSSFPGEREVLFMPGTRFRIDSVVKENDKYIINATEV